MSVVDAINRGAGALHLELTPQQRQFLQDYLGLLAKWNATYNLSAVRSIEQMVGAHILDSLALHSYIAPTGNRILDVGSGAGLPGIPLAILFPGNEFVLLDSNGKKTRFLTQVKIDLKLENVTVVQQRVEDYRPASNFAIVVSRAFTSLARFFDATRHLVQATGNFYAMKGKYPRAELEQLTGNIRINEVVPLQVPGLNADRHLVIAQLSN